MSLTFLKTNYLSTKTALSRRLPKNHKHHSFNDWNEYSIIQLPQKLVIKLGC